MILAVGRSLLALALAFAAPAPAPNELRGRVSGPDGEPLAEVRVAVVETGRVTRTDADGRYRFGNMAPGPYTVSFSLVGYAPEVRRVRVVAEGSVLDLQLREALVELPPLQVTGSAVATSALESPQPLGVVEGRELRAAQSPSLGATLETLAGVRNFSTGSGIGKPVVRGLGSNRVLVLADGQRLETQQWGEEHAPNVETADAERIEVIRGPASVLYGSDALGGVINVIPRPLPETRGRALVLGGQASGAYASDGRAPTGTVLLEGATRGLGFRGSLTGRTGDDLRTPLGPLGNSGMRALDGSLTAALHGGWGSVATTLTARDERLEIAGDPVTQPGYDGFQRIGERRARVELALPVGASRLVLDGALERNRRSEYNAAEDQDVALGLLSTTATGDLRFHHAPLGPFSGTIGVSALRTRFEKFGAQTLVPNSTTANLGLYVFEQFPVGPFGLSAGARMDFRGLDVPEDAALALPLQRRTWSEVTGNLGAIYKLSETAALALNVGRGFRAPSSFELFANGVHAGALAFERGNSGLGVERSLNVDLSARVQARRLSAELGVFVNRIDGFIYPRPTGETDSASGFRIYDVVQGDARLEGVEASVVARPVPVLELRATADYVRGTNTSTGVPLPWIPPLRVTYSARVGGGRLGPLDGIYGALGMESHARQTRVDPADFAPPGYTLMHVSAGFALPWAAEALTVDLSVRNLLDEHYRRFLSRYKTYALEPGRSVTARVSLDF